MTKTLAPAEIIAAHEKVVAALLAEKSPDGWWRGELSASALATATAVSAFSCREDAMSANLIANALPWLADDQNLDGGWGDSPESPSNLATTLLVRAALALAGVGENSNPAAQPIGEVPSIENQSDRVIDFAKVLRDAEAYLTKHAGASSKERQAALIARYGNDHTFAVPIMMNCALAGQMDWRRIPALPFELAGLPRGLFALARWQVVSYALPALIAIGQVLFHFAPPKNPFTRLLRWGLRRWTLRTLQKIQPASGGFLEAIPLTAFVTMSLCALGMPEHPVVKSGFRFLERTARVAGCWAVDTDLTIWLTSSAYDALAAGGVEFSQESTRRNLLHAQMRRAHPYTGAAPGGWAWTDKSGGVPDADDTAGVLLALARGDDAGAATTTVPIETVRAGVDWLLGLQNRGGGWPTFCRGWESLPFDQSAADLTAHVLRALLIWQKKYNPPRLGKAVEAGFSYLREAQTEAGAWVPLWFGSQRTADGKNPVFGTARVLRAFTAAQLFQDAAARRGVEFLLSAQNSDGSWGSDAGISGTLEETALAVDSLLDYAETVWGAGLSTNRPEEACAKGVAYLTTRINESELPLPAAPLGLYFASLWYSERLYPLIWTTAALGRSLRCGMV